MCSQMHQLSSPLDTEETFDDIRKFIVRKDLIIGDLVGMGGYADVFKGTLINEANGSKTVAVKRFRFIIAKEIELMKLFSRELRIWANLSHKNVLILLGMTRLDGAPALASEYMEEGTMVEYLKNHGDVNILTLVKGIACGLEYLHAKGVIHSDLRGDNVLMAHDGRPVLSDFGISRLRYNSVTIAGTGSLKGNLRWMAPELLETTDNDLGQLHTKATDVWAFGMVIYEALSGKVPFYNCRNDGQLTLAILSGRIPSEPQDALAFGSLLWECCRRCWEQDHKIRPTISELRTQLNRKNSLTVETFAGLPIQEHDSSSWISPTGRFIAIRAKGGRSKTSITLLQTKTMSQCGPELSMCRRVYELVWSSEEDHIVTTNRDGILRKWINIFHSAVCSVESKQKHDHAKLKYSPHDRFIVSVGWTEAKLWDPSNLSQVWVYRGGNSWISFRPSGHGLFFGCDDNIHDVGTEDLINITSTKHKLTCRAHFAEFSPNGTSCAIRTDTGVSILSTDTFEEITQLPDLDVKALRYTPEGKYIVFVLASKAVILWDVEARRRAKELVLDLDLNGRWEAEILKGCRIVRLYNISGRNPIFFQLMSTYY